MLSDTQMKNFSRGTSVIQVVELDDVELRVAKWHDNRGETLLTNFATVEPQNTVNRWDSKRYSKYMGVIDLLDSLLALYRISQRSKKWYHKLLWHFLEMLLIQAWFLYIRDFDLTDVPIKTKLPLLMFKLEVANCLLQKGKSV